MGNTKQKKHLHLYIHTSLQHTAVTHAQLLSAVYYYSGIGFEKMGNLEQTIIIELCHLTQ